MDSALAGDDQLMASTWSSGHHTPDTRPPSRLLPARLQDYIDEGKAIRKAKRRPTVAPTDEAPLAFADLFAGSTSGPSAVERTAAEGHVASSTSSSPAEAESSLPAARPPQPQISLRELMWEPGEKPFPCPVKSCLKAYATSGDLYQHKRVKHPQLVEQQAGGHTRPSTHHPQPPPAAALPLYLPVCIWRYSISS